MSPRLGSDRGTTQSFLPLAAPALRYQVVLDPGSFAGAASVAIRELEFRLFEGARNAVHGGVWTDMELRLAFGPKGLRSSSVQQHFDSNVDTSTRTTVFSRKRFTLPKVGGANGLRVRVPFDSAASFGYGTGMPRALVVEVRIWTNEPAAWLAYPMDAIDANGRIDILGVPQACPTSTNFVPNQFANASTCVVGSALHEHIGFVGASGVVGLGVLGFSHSAYGPLRLPLDLGPLGAPGCSLGVSLDLPQAAVSDGNGKLRYPLLLPGDPGLRGATFYTQILALDPNANALGMATSPVLAQRIGGDPEAATIVGFNGPMDNVGQALAQQAPVLRFR